MNLIFHPQVAWKHVRGNQKYGDVANHEWMGYRKSRKLLRKKIGPEAAIGISKELVTLPTCFFETDQPALRLVRATFPCSAISHLGNLPILRCCIVIGT
jgi:hypothetical protein